MTRSHSAEGIRNIKHKINIQAPVESCYQAWIHYTRFPTFMRRVLGVEHEIKTIDATYAKALNLSKYFIPAEQINRWLFAGPGGKLYETESKIILDIPNLFYCRVSTDPDDIAIQTSVLFSADEMNQNTLIEFQVSFWDCASIKAGKSTQLILDILNQGDSLIEDCLLDLKHYVEHKKPRKTKPARALIKQGMGRLL